MILTIVIVVITIIVVTEISMTIIIIVIALAPVDLVEARHPARRCGRLGEHLGVTLWSPRGS